MAYPYLESEGGYAKLSIYVIKKKADICPIGRQPLIFVFADNLAKSRNQLQETAIRVGETSST